MRVQFEVTGKSADLRVKRGKELRRRRRRRRMEDGGSGGMEEEEEGFEVIQCE